MIISLTAEESLYLDDSLTILSDRAEVQVSLDLKLRLGMALLAALHDEATVSVAAVPVDFDSGEIVSMLQAIKGTDIRGNEHVGWELKKKFFAALLATELPEGTPELSSIEEGTFAVRKNSNTHEGDTDYDPQD